MTLAYDPILSLESIGYLEREAAFLYLVAVHSGYFMRRQYARFVGRDGGTLFSRFLKRANRRGHIRVIECEYGWHIYHLISKPVYEALGRQNSQNRRIKSDAHIKSRLMVLDFLLSDLHASVLEDEASKVAFFTTQCRASREVLPRSSLGQGICFPDGFPILVSDKGIPRFTFFDEGHTTATRFERYLGQYQPLFEKLGPFELTFVADSDSNSARARVNFDRFLPADRLRGVTPLTPMGVDHFLEYLRAQRQAAVGTSLFALSDVALLHEGEHLYATLEHRALQAAWNNGSTSAERIRQRFSQSSFRATFTTVVLPYRYPFDLLKQQAQDENGCAPLRETLRQTPSIGDKQ